MPDPEHKLSGYAAVFSEQVTRESFAASLAGSIAGSIADEAALTEAVAAGGMRTLTPDQLRQIGFGPKGDTD